MKAWHTETKNLETVGSDPRGRQVVLYKMADICTTLLRQYLGAVGDVSRALGGALAAPSIDATNIRLYLVDLQGFGAINDLITIVTRGVPVTLAPAGADLRRALRYGNHRSAKEHFPAIWEELREDIHCQKCIVIRKEAAHEIPGLRVSPLGAVVTHKVRIINDFSFEAQSKGTKGGLNADTDPDTVPQCLCAEAFPKFLTELVSLRKKCPNKRILMSKADVSDPFRNVRGDPDKAHNFCYTVGELIVILFPLTFVWSVSPGFWGVIRRRPSKPTVTSPSNQPSYCMRE